MDYGHIYDNFYYGYGKIIYKADNEIIYYYQDGGLPGYRSIYIVYPNLNFKVVLLSNYKFTDTVTIVNEIGKLIYDNDMIFEID